LFWELQDIVLDTHNETGQYRLVLVFGITNYNRIYDIHPVLNVEPAIFDEIWVYQILENYKVKSILPVKVIDISKFVKDHDNTL